jgi:hypothetical protein
MTRNGLKSAEMALRDARSITATVDENEDTRAIELRELKETEIAEADAIVIDEIAIEIIIKHMKMLKRLSFTHRLLHRPTRWSSSQTWSNRLLKFQP